MDKLKAVSATLQKINLAHLIGEMEKHQEVAYQLEHINSENIEELKRREMVKEAVAACMKAIEEHLDGYLCENPNAVYEDWIRHLHPDNADFVDDSGRTKIDHRFYVEDSDHRRMWNEYMEKIDCVERIVDSRHILPSYSKTKLDVRNDS